jgi:hypothetical protein
MAGGTAADPGFVWALGVGIVLIGLGLLGFVPNPLVGAPSAAWGTPLLLTGDAHDVLHLVGGAVALHAALGMSRARRDAVLIGLGAVALVLLALGLLDGRWFGIAPYSVGLADQLLHLVVGLGSLVMGLAGTGTIVVPVVTGAYRRSALGLGAGTAASEPEALIAPEEADADGVEPAVDEASDTDTNDADAEVAEAKAEPVSTEDTVEAMPAEAMPEPLGLGIDEAAQPSPDPTPVEQRPEAGAHASGTEHEAEADDDAAPDDAAPERDADPP